MAQFISLLLPLEKYVLIVLLIAAVCVGKGANLKEELGDVVLVCSRGRSGSGYIIRVIANLADAKTERAVSGELFYEKFGMMERMKNPKKFLKKYFRDRRKEIGTDGGFIGSKWKPYVDNLRYDRAWQWVKEMDWPVIFSYRNPLDVYISQLKHNKMQLPPHCRSGDQKCLEDFKSVRVNVDPYKAMAIVKEEVLETQKVRQKLKEMRIRYVEVTYEKIAYGSEEDRVKYIQNLADFFIPKTRKRVATAADLHTQIEYTGSYNQSNFVQNMGEIKAFFSNTSYEYLVHP